MKSLLNFLKNWTLPAAIATGIVVYSIFFWVPALDAVGERLEGVFDTILPLFMGMILFTTFCRVDFHRMRLHRWHVWVTVAQVLLVAMTAAVILGYRLTGRALIGMEGVLTCIIGPGAAAAAVVTSKLGGNLESMTTYTFLSNFVTALLVPLIFPLIDPDVTMTFWKSFLLILYKVCLVLVLPIVAAYVVKHWMHRLHRLILGIEDLSFYMWGISLSIVTGVTVKNIVHADTTWPFLLTLAVLAAVLCMMQFAVGRYIGHFFDATIESGQGLGQKNTAFAIWIAYTYLNPLSSVGPVCYILWQNAVNSLELWHRRKKAANPVNNPVKS